MFFLLCYFSAPNVAPAPSGVGLANEAIGNALSRAMPPPVLSTGSVTLTVAPTGTSSIPSARIARQTF